MRARAAVPSLLLLAAWAVMPGPLGATQGAATAVPFAVAPTPATARAAIVAIEACVRRLDPERDVGFARIASVCPGLVAAIEASDTGAALPGEWKHPRNELSAGGLRALRRALAEPGPAAPRRAAPDTDVLTRLVATSREATATDAGSWVRLTRWLRSVIERADPRDVRPDPLARRFADLSVPQRVWTVMGYVAVAALLVFVAWLVRAELAAAGLLTRGPARRSGAARGAAGAVEADGGALDAVALLERPAWLLRRLAARLQALGRLPPPGHLTPRELARAAQLDDAGDREPLRAIAAAAERVRFGATPPSSQELAPAIEAGAALLRRLAAGGPSSRTDPGAGR